MPTPEVFPEVLNIVELKEFLCLDYDRTNKLLTDGVIPSVRINDHGDRRIFREDAIAYLIGKKR
jgi:hypothetical protein